MSGNSIWRRLRGAIGTAVLWGAAWCGAVFAVGAVMALMGKPVDFTGLWQMAARLSVVGALTGGAFSLVIGLMYRGRRLSDISWIRFGIGGGVVAGLFVPGMMLLGRTISGDGPLPMENWISSAVLAAVFGTVAAGASMKLAQRSNNRLGDGREDERELLNSAGAFTSTDSWDAGSHHAERAAERVNVRSNDTNSHM